MNRRLSSLERVSVPFERIATEIAAMTSDEREGGRVREQRHRRRRRRRAGVLEPPEPAWPAEPAPPAPPAPANFGPDSRSDAEALEDLDASLLSDEERVYLDAQRRVDAKVKLYREAVKAALISVPLLIFIPFVGVIVAAYSVVRLGRRYYSELIEPGVRDRLVREEVSKRVDASVHAEKRALEGEHARSLEQLAASIAHEIRNPITAAKSLVQQMGEEPASTDNLEYARVALGELERVERSVSHLLRFARDEDLRAVDVEMAEVLDSALETFRERAAREQVEIVRHFDRADGMRGDPEKLRRIAINLIGNAMDSLSETPVDEPCVEVAMGENLAGTEIWVRVRDNGPGIDSATRDKMFSPFFTSKQTGTGLGLPITKKLVEAHGGTVEVSSQPGGGAEFLVTFPKAGASS